jgi:hypothetical protein
MTLYNNFLIPLSNTPQRFLITLAGVQYTLTCRWNAQADAGWILDIANSNQVPIVTNIPLIVGDDLLDGLEYLMFGGSLYVFNANDPNAVPTIDNLGTDSNLYFQVSNG